MELTRQQRPPFDLRGVGFAGASDFLRMVLGRGLYDC